MTITSNNGEFLLDQIYPPYYKIIFTKNTTDLYTVASFAKYGYINEEFVNEIRESGLDNIKNIAVKFNISYRFLNDKNDNNFDHKNKSISILYRHKNNIYPVAIQRINGDIVIYKILL